VSSRPRGGPQQAIAAVAAALTSSRDQAIALGAAAEAIAQAANASRVEIWGGVSSGSVVCEAVWSRGEATPVSRQAPADLEARPDLRAVFDGGDAVEWRAADDLPEAARALLETHSATRSLTLALRVGDQTGGAVTIVQTGPTAKTTTAERKRLALLSQLVAGAVHSAGAASTTGTATRRADALRAASRAVAGLVESDQAVGAVTQQVAALVGGRECRVRVYLRTDSGTYAEFPPPPADEGANGVDQERPNELERQALEERRTVTAAAAQAIRLATPLLLRGAPLGFLTLIAARSRPLSPGEVQDIETLAQQICLTLDIARLRRSVQRLTTIDTLTGLKNREFLFERLTAEIARARRYQEPLSLILLDLDDFSSFNAAHGNREGNRLLRTAANLVKTSIRDRVDVACRYGGAQFALLFPNTPATAAGAGVVAERIRKSIDATQFHDDNDNRLAHVTVSLGVAGFPVHAEDAEDLVSLAAEALRAAKAAGKNRVGLYSLPR
jgi:diguanylate cyclase (GGDEF)-like protein